MGAACAGELYCAFPVAAQCGAADQTGVCQPVPDMCAQLHDPVCGCNDRTYSNACAAAADRVSVAKAGSCEPAAAAGSIGEGKLCGTRGVAGNCAAGLYCAYRSQCGDNDSGGLCQRRATVCTRIYQPVCGCDGKNYGNPCEAASAGVSVRAPGTCAS